MAKRINPFASQQPLTPKPNERVNGVTIFKPIIYGNISFPLDEMPSKQDDNQEWFRWTVYVRGADNEDLSYFIKSVVFYLHDSYAEPTRVVRHAPFELTEDGWGQFEIKIEIHFHDIADSTLSTRANNTKQTHAVIVNGANGNCHKNGTAMNTDGQRNGNTAAVSNDSDCAAQTKLSSKRTYRDMVSADKTAVVCHELPEAELKRMVKETETGLLSLIPACYDSASENKVTLIHLLRLFTNTPAEDVKRTVIEETYSEIEFIDPYYDLYAKLVTGPHSTHTHHPFSEHWQNSVAALAEKEQALIKKISVTHQNLLSKIEAANMEYRQLVQK